MKLLIWGFCGRLGQTLQNDAKNKKYIDEICGFDKFTKEKTINGIEVYNDISKINKKFDYIIDFSKPESIDELLHFSVSTKTPLVIATTGHSEEQLKKINEASKNIAIFKSTNMSLGINLLIELAKTATKVLKDSFDIEIIEQHHNIKVDSPSGTAITIAEAINSVCNNEKELIYGRHSNNSRRDKKEIGMHSIRGGSVIGKHDVLFLGNDEFITLSHEAQSKSIFTEGALKAANFIKDKAPGLYSMSDLLKNII